MSDEKNIERIDHLIDQGKILRPGPRSLPRSADTFVPGIVYVDDLAGFSVWRAQSLAYLLSILEPEHPYLAEFRKITEGYLTNLELGIRLLEAAQIDLKNGRIEKPNAASINAAELVEQICSRFPLIARQLELRHDNRATLIVSDEYDVQDFFHALLHLHFEDIRPEEYTPSYAGKSTRMDFLLKREQIVIELKKTRSGLGAKELSQQIIEDIQRYKTHPSCQTLICFVYDPDKTVSNPRGIEADLRRDGDPFPVRVLIRS